MIVQPSIVKQAPNGKGLGIFACRKYEIGTVIWFPCQDCKIYGQPEISRFSADSIENLDEYGFRLLNGDIMMPCSHTFLLNHSCECNVLDFGLQFGIAVRTILPGEEFTIDYSTFHADIPWDFPCDCKTASCRKTVTAHPDVYKKVKDASMPLVLNAVRKMQEVDQPLNDLLIAQSDQYLKLMNSLESQSILDIESLDGSILQKR